MDDTIRNPIRQLFVSPAREASARSCPASRASRPARAAVDQGGIRVQRAIDGRHRRNADAARWAERLERDAILARRTRWRQPGHVWASHGKLLSATRTGARWESRSSSPIPWWDITRLDLRELMRANRLCLSRSRYKGVGDTIRDWLSPKYRRAV